MKKIILFLLSNICVAAAIAAPEPCELTEQLLYNELATMSSGYSLSVEDHVKTARIYQSMALRGCTKNAETHKAYMRASLDAARSLVEINAENPADRMRHNTLIQNTALRAFH